MSVYPTYALWSTKQSAPFNSQIPEEVISICRAAQPQPGSQVMVVKGKRARIMLKRDGIYTILALATDADRIKSKRILEGDVDALLSAAPVIESTLEGAEARVRRLLHNLKTLTAKMSQEIFEIALQNRMMENPKQAVPYVGDQIRLDVDKSARAFVEILKHLSAQNAEYTAFDRLSGKVGLARPELHTVHQVLMNVAYLFFGEFIRKKVFVDVGRTQVAAKFDYESIHVCIYYLFENATKYVKPGSEIQVTVTSEPGQVYIKFSMESLIILPEEEAAIFKEGFSGKFAKAEQLQGAGIGLYLAREMARLNNGRLDVLPGRAQKNSTYARNAFVLALPAN